MQLDSVCCFLEQWHRGSCLNDLKRHEKTLMFLMKELHLNRITFPTPKFCRRSSCRDPQAADIQHSVSRICMGRLNCVVKLWHGLRQIFLFWCTCNFYDFIGPHCNRVRWLRAVCHSITIKSDTFPYSFDGKMRDESMGVAVCEDWESLDGLFGPCQVSLFDREIEGTISLSGRKFRFNNKKTNILFC